MKYVLTLLLVMCFATIHAQNAERFIDVNGASEIMVQADQIKFVVQIKTIGQTLAESKKLNDASLDKLLSILKNNGIAKDDMEVSPITFGKNIEYTNKGPVQKGFFTNEVVTFTLKDFSKYYTLSDELSKESALEITNSTYEVSTPNVYYKSAYEKALKAAKDKAEYMAAALGCKLGKVMEIDETSPVRPFYKSLNFAANTVSQEGGSGEDMSGKIELQKSVRVKFQLMD